MNDIFVYIVDLPPSIPELIAPCDSGFTIYLNARLSYHDRVRAYTHALQHVERNDWERNDVQKIEADSHK